jgi:phosphatidylglycerophosphate synthase
VTSSSPPLRPRQESLGETVRRLSRHQKPKRGAGVYSRFVNRPLGRVLAAVAFRAGLTPNGVTLISACFSLAGIMVLALAEPGPPVGVLIAVLLALGYAVDSADGQLARLLDGGTVQGEWLDHVVDCLKISLLHVSVLLGIRGTAAEVTWWFVPLAFVVVANAYFFIFILTDLLTRLNATQDIRHPAPAPLWRSMATAPTDYGLLAWCFLVWGWPSIFMPVYSLLMLGTAGYVALGLPKWFRDMGRLKKKG